MTPIQTALVFVGIPAAVILLFAALIYGASGRRSPRYRPGRSFVFDPVWFLAAERAGELERARRSAAEPHAAIEARHQDEVRPPALPAGVSVDLQRKGGARGTW
jgi:hypothetical protein